MLPSFLHKLSFFFPLLPLPPFCFFPPPFLHSFFLSPPLLFPPIRLSPRFYFVPSFPLPLYFIHSPSVSFSTLPFSPPPFPLLKFLLAPPFLHVANIFLASC